MEKSIVWFKNAKENGVDIQKELTRVNYLNHYPVVFTFNSKKAGDYCYLQLTLSKPMQHQLGQSLTMHLYAEQVEQLIKLLKETDPVVQNVKEGANRINALFE